jgi:hypothetical protein
LVFFRRAEMSSPLVGVNPGRLSPRPLTFDQDENLDLLTLLG